MIARTVKIVTATVLGLLTVGALASVAQAQDPSSTPETPVSTEAITPTPDMFSDFEDELGQLYVTENDCDAYEDSDQWCNPGEDYNCPDIPDQYKPIVLKDKDKDPFGLDGGGQPGEPDGIGCEIPGSPTPTPTTSAPAVPPVDESDVGGLPETGTNTIMLVGAGAVAITVGLGAMYLARKRRPEFGIEPVD